MPMRGTLPLVRRPLQDLQAAASLEQALLISVSSNEFFAVSAFAAAGLFASLCFGLAHPQLLALMAL